MSNLLEFENFGVEPSKRILLRDHTPVALSSKGFDLLMVLIEGRDRVVTKEELLEKVWPDTIAEENNLTVAVSGLRKALGEGAGDRKYILTVPGRGYQFVASVGLPAERRLDGAPLALLNTRETPESAAAVVDRAPPSAFKGERWRRVRMAGPVAACLIAAIFAWLYLHSRRRTFSLTSKDVVALADFENTTGDPVFDDALRQGLIVGLEQSPTIRVLSERRKDDILHQMRRSPGERVTSVVAMELCQRAGGKVMVRGSISLLGTMYLIGLTAVRCDTGEAISHEQMPAKSKEAVIGVLGQTTTRLRARLGESIASIKRYDTPLEQATTSSLEALKMYSIAVATVNEKGDSAAIPLYARAVELDPNFAMAYGSIAECFGNRGQSDLARANAAKAFALKDRLTEYERLSIESWYHFYVTGNYERAIELLELAVRDYPGISRTLNDLGTAYATLGYNDKATTDYQEALRLEPTANITRSNLAATLMALDRIVEAEALIAKVEGEDSQNEFISQTRYYLAFLRNDTEAMRHILSQARVVPDNYISLLSLEGSTEAYHGHFEKAHRVTLSAEALMENEADKESAADLWIEEAIREAQIGETNKTKEAVAKAIKLSQSSDMMTMEALALAQIGEHRQALKIIQKVGNDNPANTLIQGYWIPVVRAEIELREGRPRQAIDLLRTTEPLERAEPNGLTCASLYPAYVRGQAYLADGDGRSASTEFHKLTDHPGMVLNGLLGALAHLGNARAYSMVGEKQRARESYETFFDLWKDGDVKSPILVDAKAEYSKMMSR